MSRSCAFWAYSSWTRCFPACTKFCLSRLKSWSVYMKWCWVKYVTTRKICGWGYLDSELIYFFICFLHNKINHLAYLPLRFTFTGSHFIERSEIQWIELDTSIYCCENQNPSFRVTGWIYFFPVCTEIPENSDIIMDFTYSIDNNILLLSTKENQLKWSTAKMKFRLISVLSCILFTIVSTQNSGKLNNYG